MKVLTIIGTCISILLHAALLSSATAADRKLPVIEGSEAIATVNGEPVPFDELIAQLASLHEGTGDGEGNVARRDPTEALQRLINARLILQEARNIGLDELPEIAGAIDSFRREARKNLLLESRVRDVRSDPSEVDRAYRDAVKEVKITAVRFENEEDARGFLATVEDGTDFVEAAERAVAAGSAGRDDRGYVKASDLVTGAADAISAMEPGEVSGAIPAGERFLVLKLEDVRFPDDPAVRERTEELELRKKQGAVIQAYVAELQAKYAEIDKELLDSLDYESEDSALDKLKQDDRILARVEGADPITVAALTEALSEKFHHGIDRAIEKKRVNRRKYPAIEEMVIERAIQTEAKRTKVDETDEYREITGRFESNTLFSAFVLRVVNPDIEIDEASVRAYHDRHRGDYTEPDRMRLDALVFAKREAAEEGIARLREGADFKWMRSNAPGQLDPSTEEASFRPTREPVVTARLPEGIRNSLAGSTAGDLRLHAESGGPFYVLLVREILPGQPTPFEAVRDNLARRLFAEKQNEALDDWARRMREASEIEIFLEGDDLFRYLGRAFGGDDGPVPR